MIERIRRSVGRAVARNSDLILVFLALLIGQHFVNVKAYFARHDLLPWAALSLSVVGYLRARPFGAGHHPMLTPRVAKMSRLIRRAGAVAAPWTLLFTYDAFANADIRAGGIAAGLAVGQLVARVVGNADGQTAWNPQRGFPIFRLLGYAGAIGGGAALCGLVEYMLPNQREAVLVGRAMYVGLSFLSMGMLLGRVRNTRQREAAGRKDGKPFKSPAFAAWLALIGPASTLAVILLAGPPIDFDQAYVVSLLCVVWAALIWPPKSPIMVACVLHEVLPTGGADPRSSATANGFDTPPEGALRFNPLRTRRTLVMHPWMVPVRSSRIAELDDPVRPLWDTGGEILPAHVLGDASFEPDPYTKGDQWDVITLRLRGSEDTGNVANDAQARRIAIMRPFPPRGESARARMATYRWDEPVPESTVQILDATTEYAVLRNGDIIVISSEGVARAFEIEIGEPLYRKVDAGAFRPPQLEDYTEA